MIYCKSIIDRLNKKKEDLKPEGLPIKEALIQTPIVDSKE